MFPIVRNLKNKEGFSAISLALKLNITQIYEILIKELAKRNEMRMSNNTLSEKEKNKNLKEIIEANKENKEENYQKLVIQQGSNKSPFLQKKGKKEKFFIEIPFKFKQKPALNLCQKLGDLIGI